MSAAEEKKLSEILDCVSFLLRKGDKLDEETTLLFCGAIRNHSEEYFKLATGKDFKKTEAEEY